MPRRRLRRAFAFSLGVFLRGVRRDLLRRVGGLLLGLLLRVSLPPVLAGRLHRLGAGGALRARHAQPFLYRRRDGLRGCNMVYPHLPLCARTLPRPASATRGIRGAAGCTSSIGLTSARSLTSAFPWI